MKLKAVIEDRFPKKRPKLKKDKILIVAFLILESLFNTFLPFISGFQLAYTRNFIYLIFFLVPLFIHLRISYGRKIKIKLRRTF